MFTNQVQGPFPLCLLPSQRASGRLRFDTGCFPTAATHEKYPEMEREVTSEEQSRLYVSPCDDEFRGRLQQTQHIPMTPPELTRTAEEENVIQPLRNKVSQRTEPEAIFCDYRRGEGKKNPSLRECPQADNYDSWKSSSLLTIKL